MNPNKITLIPAIATVLALSTAVALSPANAQGKGGERNRVTFEQLDTDNSGGVTPAELAAHDTSRFTDADANGDGFLTIAELTAADPGRNADRAERRVSRMMEHRDANADGKLSAEELAPSQERIAKMFERADKDDNGELSKAEFEDVGKRGQKGKKKRGT